MAATYAETKVLEALLGRLATLSYTPALPVEWPDTEFERPTSGGYLRPSHLPAPTQQVELFEAGRNDHTGNFQVSVFFPGGTKEAPTLRPAYEVAGAICAHFKRGSDIAREGIIVTVSGPPYPSPPLSDTPGWFHLPVTIPYRARLPNPT